MQPKPRHDPQAAEEPHPIAPACVYRALLSVYHEEHAEQE
jgi:hypothetical protein